MVGGTAFQAPPSPFSARRREQLFFALSFSHAVQSIPTCRPCGTKVAGGELGEFAKGRWARQPGEGSRLFSAIV